MICDNTLLRKKQKTQAELEEDHPYYSSPEEIKSKNKECDEMSDVWSVGVIMFNLLSGEQPFDGEDRQ